jgi:hypothetical protein
MTYGGVFVSRVFCTTPQGQFGSKSGLRTKKTANVPAGRPGRTPQMGEEGRRHLDRRAATETKKLGSKIRLAKSDKDSLGDTR